MDQTYTNYPTHTTTHHHYYHDYANHAYHTYGSHAHYDGGIIHTIFMWIAHAAVSFAVWHTLGPIFHHLGIIGSVIGGIILIILVTVIWKLVTRFAT